MKRFTIRSRSVSRLRNVVMAGLLLGTACVLGLPNATGQDSDPNAAVAQLRASASKYSEAFNEKDAKALGEMWMPYGEYVDENGTRFEGRDVIKAEYEQFFKAYPDAEMKLSIDSLRMLSLTAAIEDGVTEMVVTPDGPTSRNRYTAVHVKHDGKWRLASVRDQPAQPVATTDPLGQLAWLLGNWSSEHAGVTADVSCEWLAGKSYLKRAFEIERDGDSVSTSIEIIGWDPIQQQIGSWTFDSLGGRSVGAWTRTSEGWLVEANGVTASGLPTSSVSWWAPLEDGAVGWSAASRSIGGQLLDDPRDVVLKKAEEEK